TAPRAAILSQKTNSRHCQSPAIQNSHWKEYKLSLARVCENNGTGRSARRVRPGWSGQVRALSECVELSLSPPRLRQRVSQSQRQRRTENETLRAPFT